MLDGTLHIFGRTRKVSLYIILVALVFLSLLSARTFIGAYYYGKVPCILGDRSFEESITVMDLSEETFPAYQEAIKTLEKAAIFDPSRALYRKALSELYSRIGIWAEAMELLSSPLPEGTPISKEAFEHATADIREAIRQQPTNPDYHLAYGHLSREMKNVENARNEYLRTVNAYPWNASLRYAVITEYLAAGMRSEALEQAIGLSVIDDSYKMTESAMSQSAREQRMPSYVNQLYSSYLFKVFEVIWQTSNKDTNTLRSAVPDNDEARDTFELFLETKDIQLGMD